MKIQSGTVQLQSQRSVQTQQIAQQTLQASQTNLQASGLPSENNRVSISINGLSLRTSLAHHNQQQSTSLSQVTQLDGNTQVLLAHFNLLEQAVQSQSSIDFSSLQMTSSPLSAQENVTQIQLDQITFSQSSLWQETTQLSTEALGTVITEDGRQIDFLMALDFERTEVFEQNLLVSQQNIEFKDPLVINLHGEAVSLSEAQFEFDLNMDGEAESINQTAAGSGFLALDKNQNGLIDDGSELFGPQTNAGFDELAAYDEDGNGWIDENDSVYSELLFMDFTEQGDQQLRSLAEVEVGAIFLGSTDSIWTYEDESGGEQAQLRRTGVALKEDGTALAIQEIFYPEESTNETQFTISEGSLEQSGLSEGDIHLGNAVAFAPDARTISHLTRFNQHVNQVNEQPTLSEYRPVYDRSEEELIQARAFMQEDFSLPEQIHHLKWLDDPIKFDQSEVEQTKLDYMRGLIEELRHQKDQNIQGLKRLGIYQEIQNTPNH